MHFSKNHYPFTFRGRKHHRMNPTLPGLVRWVQVRMLTFEFAVVQSILASFYQYFGSHIEGNNLGFRDEEEHDKLLAHDSQRLVFSVCRCYKGNERKASEKIIYHKKDCIYSLPKRSDSASERKDHFFTERSLWTHSHRQ